MRLSCHQEPFAAFTRDLQIPGCEVHLYYGPNKFGSTWDETMLAPKGDVGGAQIPYNWERQNIYFLPGVKPGLTKRAADSDVLKRGMFTLDFDIKKELEKDDPEIPVTDEHVENMMNAIISALCFQKATPYGSFRYAVASGNGLHLHYFGEPVDVVKEEWVAGMKAIFADVATITPIPPDFGCGNAGRIMRMPGSWNVKDPAHPKPVTIECWQQDFTIFDMKYVQERGREAIAKLNEVKQQERAEFADSHPDGGSDVIDLINAIPIEQIVKQLLNCEVKNVKKDGGMRFIDESGTERGFFRHHQYNIIVHEGTGLFPPPASGIGYNCLSLAKCLLKTDAAGAIQWFAERSARVRELREKERTEWIEQNKSHEVELFEQRYAPPHD